MIRVTLVVAGLLLGSVSAHADLLLSVDVSPESDVLVEVLCPPAPGVPAFISLLTNSTEPTVLEFEKVEQAFTLDLTVQQINNTGVVFEEGLHFRIENGSFNEFPAFELPILTDAAVLSIEAPDELVIPTPVEIGGIATNTLSINFFEGPSATLTITPLVPEPGLTACMLAMVPLMRRSRQSRVAG